MVLKLNPLLNLICWLSFLLQGVELKSQQDLRIINGQETNWNSTRYQVSIRLESLDRYLYGIGHLCGGSIISRSAILTASHCIWNANSNSFYSASNFSVVMGNVDRTLKNNNSLKLSVSKIITGPHFNYNTFRDDLAILILNQSIPESFTAAEVIELYDNKDVADGKNCIVTGWGLTENQTYTRNLMLLEVPVINRATCSANYGVENILDGMLCTGYMNGKGDACTGDSGGPLVCDNKLVGIVSFGLGCAIPGYPGIYTNVGYYYEWIRSHILVTNKNIELPNKLAVFNNNSTNTSIIGDGNSSAKIICNNVVTICLVIVNLMIYKFI